MSETKLGRVIAIVGPAVDVEFAGHLPAIYNALTVGIDSGDGCSLGCQQTRGGFAAGAQSEHES